MIGTMQILETCKNELHIYQMNLLKQKIYRDCPVPYVFKEFNQVSYKYKKFNN